MDYRTRHPNQHFWSRNVIRASRSPAHYGSTIACMFEIDAPDGTEFLALSGGLSQDEKMASAFAMEAPKSCPMRLLFESGDLSWLEYWTHKSWFIYLENDLWNEMGCIAQYVSSSVLSLDTIDRLKRLGTTSPYELTRRALELGVEHAYMEKEAGFSEFDPKVAERQYHDYLQKYGHRLKSLKVA